MVDADPNLLQRSLAQLQSELARTPRLDQSKRLELQAALAEIARTIPRSGAAPTVDTAPHGLEELAIGFEAEHPTLAASLRQFIDLLAQAGL